MAEIIREAIREKLDAGQRVRSRHGGAFASGRTDTAERSEELLDQTRFGTD